MNQNPGKLQAVKTSDETFVLTENYRFAYFGSFIFDFNEMDSSGLSLDDIIKKKKITKTGFRNKKPLKAKKP